MNGLPVLDLGDDPYERGLVHGRALVAAIADNVETYLARFAASGLAPMTRAVKVTPGSG